MSAPRSTLNPATWLEALGLVVVLAAWLFRLVRGLIRWLLPRCGECGGRLRSNAEKDIGLCADCLGFPGALLKGSEDDDDDDREKKKVPTVRGQGR